MPEIPSYSELASIYGLQGTADAMQRYSALAADFKVRYGEHPKLFARAPGRVNLIGEHIDYEGYGVLPMAVSRDAVVAIALAGTTLDVSNHDDVRVPQYAAYSFCPDPTQLVDTENHVWANYALAAYKGVHDYLSANPAMETSISRSFPGIKLLVHGTVPLGSGLSSSSALVVAVAVALLAAYGVAAQQEDVAAFSCAAERYVGVNSGGMDQAISVMARPGEAAFIQFDPVRASPVPLPDDCTFVVAHSLAVSAKKETAELGYNLRVIECRMAAIMLAVALGHPPAQARQLRTLQQVEGLVRHYYQPQAEQPDGVDAKPAKKVPLPEDVQLLDECAEAAQRLLQAEPYTAAQVQEAINGGLEPQHHQTLDTLFADFPGAMKTIGKATEIAVNFQLQARAVHVYSEASRVLRFKNICASPDSTALKLVTLGGLMRKSHESLKERYQCSCPELDELMVASKRLGAFGGRLTGAGWGGASVHLVRTSQVPQFIDGLKREFYSRKLQTEGSTVTEETIDEYVFPSAPAHGAAIATTQCIIPQ